ncbi:hypothetical protein SLUN_17535 [Streptomyces lunaelactis]|uniref:AG2 protein n=2 Tax=Streptomyces lunaelactis TaxID=1535768 RepID=A0A2R4TEJ2_9ACTN|nr:hypothetical protein SLUN_17535 [Streptomyces lunaelactis]NUK86467.1 hypothetical protein [Streptomyces lunaelactis]
MDVAQVDLGKLSTAVSDWKKTVDNLQKLAKSATSGMVAKSESARWAGENATVTREFVKKTAKQFADAHAEAKSIWTLLDDAHAELVAIQKSMKTAVDVDAPNLGVRIEDIGGGAVRWYFPHIRGDSDERTQKQLDAAQALADRITGLIAHAAEIDANMARALGRTNKNNPNDFSSNNYTSLDDAEKDRALELAKLGPKMNDKQFAEFNSIMKYNTKDPEFADAFYRGLGGPKQALEFFGQMSIDSAHGDNKARLELTKELQRNMGLTLATATDPDHNPGYLKDWGGQFRKLGTQQIPLEKYGMDSPPFGYQLLGGIMRYGDYDPKFLNPIAEHVIQLQQKDPILFAHSKSEFGTNLYNPSGKDGAGFDPVPGMLEALGHSPEAAKQFFTAEPTAYNEDGTVKGGAADLGKVKDEAITNYLDYFTNDDYKGFPGDINGHYNQDAIEKATNHMPDALGHALEAATLGHAYDDPTPKLVRDEDSAAIMKSVVEKYGDADLLNRQEALSDSLGRMGAGYVDDINWALNDNDPTSMFAPQRDPADHAEFGRDGARNFLNALGQHPDAYAELSNAEKVYTTSVLEAQVGDNGTINEAHAREAVRAGGEVQGMLDESRADRVKADGLAKDEAYNKALEKRAGWIGFGAGVGVAAGAAFLPPVAAAGVAATLIPIVTDAGTGALEQQLGNVIGDWTESKQQNSGDDVLKQRLAIYDAGEATSEAPMREFMKLHGIERDGRFGGDLEEALNSGYGKGSNRAAHMAQS